MKIIESSVQLLTPLALNESALTLIEFAGRTCYKSENLMTDETAKNFVSSIIKRGHLSVIEHSSVSVKFVVDRGVSHEIVRHRLASYSQESTRYCNYSKDKFGNELTFIRPVNFTEGSEEYETWENAMERAERTYLKMVNELKVAPQDARSVLPNSLKTELIMTTNLREWRHFFQLRTSGAAHPDMRWIAIQLLSLFAENIPAVFDDLWKEITINNAVEEEAGGNI